MKPRTHREIANQLNVPLNVVAITREIVTGTSAASQRAMVESGAYARAAQWLAQLRRCHSVAEAITPEIVAEVVAMDNGGGRP